MRQVWYDDPRSISAKIASAKNMGMSLSGCWTADSLDYRAGAPIDAYLYWQALEIKP